MATILLVEDDTSMRLLTTAKRSTGMPSSASRMGWRPWTCWNGSQWT